MMTIILELFIGLILLNSPAFALSDEDYENLKSKSPDFAEADKRLGETWKRIRASLNEDAKNSLRSEQREWIKTGWDARANELMNNNDLPKSQAYTQAINERIKYLENYSNAESASIATNNKVKGNNIIEVNASGLGTSKNDALEDAWMDAIRKAVGVYLSGKTEVNNDELKEKILAHSRGQVKSYKEIASSLENGMWKVNIVAQIDKDILKEPEKNTSTQKLTFDGTDIAAQETTLNKKDKTTEELLVDSAENIDFKKLINYKSSIITMKDRRGKTYAYLWNTIFINLKNYNTEVEPFEKVTAQCALKAYEVDITTNAGAKNIFKLLSNPSLIKTEPTSEHDLQISNAGETYGIGYMKKVFSREPAICFYKNIKKGMCYDIDRNLFSKLNHIFNKRYKINFSAESGEGFGNILGTTWVPVKWPFTNDGGLTGENYFFFSPQFTVFNGEASIYQIGTKLDLDKSDLMNIKEITSKIEIETMQGR